jgi:hypothetical protein
MPKIDADRSDTAGYISRLRWRRVPFMALNGTAMAGPSSVGVDGPAFVYGKGFAAVFLLAVTSYGGGTRAQIPTARSPTTNSGVGDCGRGPEITD